MALIFNLDETIKAASTVGCSLRDILVFSKEKRIPKNSRSKYLSVDIKKILNGYSYLINDTDLFRDNVTDSTYIDQYIMLAGRRDYHLYKMYNYTKLPLSYFPDLNMDSIKYNPLLKVDGDGLLFKYEPK